MDRGDRTKKTKTRDPGWAATPTRGREATTGTWRRRRSSSQGTGDTKDTIYKYTKCVF